MFIAIPLTTGIHTCPFLKKDIVLVSPVVFHKFMKTSLEIKKKLFDTNSTQNNHIFFLYYHRVRGDFDGLAE